MALSRAKCTKRKKSKSNRELASQSAHKEVYKDNKNKKKTRIYTKKRCMYSQETLNQAVADIKAKSCSINKASKLYGIPVGTLFNKVHGKVPLEKRMGPATVLTKEEEMRIKQWILDKAEIGYPMHHMIVRLAVKAVLDKIKRPNPFKNNLPGEKWLKLFLARHPDIKNKRTEMLSRVRAAVTEPRIRAWFTDVKQYLSENNSLDILHDPTRIYNMDETGVCLCPKTGKLLAPVKQKHVYSISPGQDRQQITVLCCFSATGVSVRPMIMYPYKRNLPQDIIASVPKNYAIGHSETGWMTTASFYEYIVNCFYPQLLQNEVKFPVILFFDGHSSHISIELHDFCVEKQIFLYCFIAHASHIMQPLDVGFFRPLKVSWRKAVADHAQQTNKIITKVNFAPIFDKAFAAVLTKPEIVQKSFEKSGIFPFNADKVDYSKCITFRREAIKNSAQATTEISAGTVRTTIESQITSAAVSYDIESQIPAEILKQFQDHLFMGTEPAEEKILFSIWKSAKEVPINFHYVDVPGEGADCDSLNLFVFNEEATHETVISHEKIHDNLVDILPVNKVDSMVVLDNGVLASNVSIEIIDVHNVDIQNNCDDVVLDVQTCAKETKYARSNVENIIEETRPLVLTSTTCENEKESTENIKMVYSQSTFTPSPIENSLLEKAMGYDENSQDSGILTEEVDNFQHQVLDLSNNSRVNFEKDIKSPKEDIVLLNPFSTVTATKQASPSLTETPAILDNTRIVKNDLLGQELTSPKLVNQVWKEHLHFPRIEVSDIKKKKNVDAPIHALTSEQWKMAFKKKKEEEEIIKQEKELKKKLKEEEKIIKQKIKIETTESKKKMKEEQKILRQAIKQEEVECRRKAREEERLRKIQEKLKLKEEEKPRKRMKS